MKQVIFNEYIHPDGSVDVHALRQDLFDYFNTLHYMLSDTEFDTIAQHALGWLQDHLSTHEVFERSVRSKAYDISSGDHHADYYKALLIRRDQLLAARDVFREYTFKLRDIFTDQRDQVLESLKKFNFEEGIYLRAVEYSRAREQALANYDAFLEGEIADLNDAIELEESYLNLESADNDNTASAGTPSKGENVKKTRVKRTFHRNI